jgi:pilus assembly protein Flp/PilA
MQHIRKFLKNSKGATAIEYGLLAALIAIALMVGMRSLSTSLNRTFNNVGSNLPST